MSASSVASPENTLNSDRPTAILVVNYRTALAVEKLLDTLTQEPEPHRLHISIWDNSQDDAEFAALKNTARSKPYDSFGRLIYNRSNQNLGYAAGNNSAWRALQTSSDETLFEFVIVINPDVFIKSGSIADLEQSLKSRPGCLYSVQTLTKEGLMTGQGALSQLSGKTRQLALGQKSRRHDLIYPGGHFIAMDSVVWNELEGFCEDYFLYSEEADLALRLRDRRGRDCLATSDTLTVTHHEGLSTHADAREGKSLVTLRHATRSRIILYKKHSLLRPHLLSVTILRLAWALTYICRGQGAQARAVLHGVVDGLKWHSGGVR